MITGLLDWTASVPASECAAWDLYDTMDEWPKWFHTVHIQAIPRRKASSQRKHFNYFLAN
eukprot:1955136-Amphidinium_carterae.1